MNFQSPANNNSDFNFSNFDQWVHQRMLNNLDDCPALYEMDCVQFFVQERLASISPNTNLVDLLTSYSQSYDDPLIYFNKFVRKIDVDNIKISNFVKINPFYSLFGLFISILSSFPVLSILRLNYTKEVSCYFYTTSSAYLWSCLVHMFILSLYLFIPTVTLLAVAYPAQFYFRFPMCFLN